MACGCIVTTINANIVDWKPHCDGHKAAFDNAINSHDQWIEDMIFGDAEGAMLDVAKRPDRTEN